MPFLYTHSFSFQIKKKTWWLRPANSIELLNQGGRRKENRAKKIKLKLTKSPPKHDSNHIKKKGTKMS